MPGTRRLARRLLIVVAASFVRTEPPRAAESALFVRRYTVIRASQQVILREAVFGVDSSCRLVLGQAVPPDDVAVEALKQDLNVRFNLTLREGRMEEGEPALLLDIRPGPVPIGEALDKDHDVPRGVPAPPPWPSSTADIMSRKREASIVVDVRRACFAWIMEVEPYTISDDVGVPWDIAETNGPAGLLDGVLVEDLQHHGTVLSHALDDGPS